MQIVLIDGTIRMKDVLSDIFDTIRLRGTLYFRTDFSPPWAISVPAYEETARFHLVIQGRLNVRLPSGASHDLNAGDLILIPRGREHVLADSKDTKPATLETVIQDSGYDGNGVFAIGQANPKASTQMVCGHLGFTKGADHPLLGALPESFILTPSDRARHPALDEALRLMTRQAYSDTLGSAATVARLAEVFFIEALSASIETTPELQQIMKAFTDRQIGKALQLLHANPHESWSVESLASETGMSRSRFAERFTNLVGTGPIAYLSEWRLQRALNQLTETTASVKEIAHATGYRSPAAFTRAFSHRFGTGPKDYRNQVTA